MGDRKATLTAVLVDSVSGPAKHIKAEITGIGEAAGRVGSVLQGIGQGIGQALFHTFERGLSAIAEAIPNLLDQGNAYLAQLHQIQLETGMTAEQTSTLVGVMKNLGVPAEDLATLFARLGANIGRNEGLFRQLGVATRAADGSLLDSYQIVENLRRAVSSHGESLLSTAAAQELFGRSAFNLLPFLQATDAQLATSTENVRRWGGVVNQQTIDGARSFENTLASLRSGITDIGVNIASAVDPYLRAFVDSFARFVQSHLNEIVNFAVGVVNVITGFVSGLLGMTDSLDVSAGAAESSTGKAAKSTDNFGKVLKTASGGADAFTQSINAQIKAIDAHVHALEQAAERRRAIQERQRLTDSLHAAQAQLADLKGNAPFTEGLSNAEQALALQKHAQDIIDAEKNVHDQRQALGDFEADQKDRAERELLNREKDRLRESLAAHKATNAEILNSGLRMGVGLENSAGKVLGNLGIKSAEFGRTAAASFKTGVDAARGFLDILLGAETANAEGPLHGGASRQGGVVGALRAVGGAFSVIGDAAGWLISQIGPVISAFDDMAKQLDVIQTAVNNAGKAIHEFIVNILGNIKFQPGSGTITDQHASGGVFDTLGPTRIGGGIMGEAGGETVAIVAHPRALANSAAGEYVQAGPIQVTIPGLARELFEFFDERLYVKAANSPVGLQAFRGATR